jgi:molybdopterin-guanine dinucleotide biosynthesis protein A
LDDLTGLVLAGGTSRRMGRDKAFLELNGRPLIQIVVNRMADVCAEVLIVARNAERYAGLGVPVVEDRFPGVGVLGGLHAGLGAATSDLSLAVGCDVALLRRGTETEPLHAAYRRTCLPAIEAAIRAGKRRIITFFPQVDVRYVAPEEVTPFEPRFESFRNVNTPEEWEATRVEWSQM